MTFRAQETRSALDLAEALREVEIIAGIDPGAGTNESTPGRRVAIGVTSPHFGDGKTTIAITLASLLAQDFQADVTLVDADFHTHSTARQYGLQGEAGLAELLAENVTLESVTHRVSQAKMNVITAGNVPADPARIARSSHLAGLIENMKRANDYVVIDLPATLHSMDAPVLARRCDGVIVVIRAGQTRRRDLERVLHLLKDAPILGVLVNRTHSAVPGVVRRALNLQG